MAKTQVNIRPPKVKATNPKATECFGCDQAGSRAVKPKRAPYADAKSRLPDDFSGREARASYHEEAFFGNAPSFKKRVY